MKIFSHQPTPQSTPGQPLDSSRKGSYFTASLIRRGIVHYLSGRGITAFAAVLVPLLLVRFMEVTDYAGYTAFSGLLMLLEVVSEVGIKRVVPRYLPELRITKAEAELRWTCRWLILIRAVLLILILGAVVLCYPFLAGWFKLPASMKLVWAFAMYSFSFSMSRLVDVSLQTLMLQKQAVVGMVLEWYLKLLLLITVLLALGGIDLLGALLIQGCSMAVGLLYMLWQLEKHFFLHRDRVFKLEEKLLDWRQMAKTGLQNYLWVLSGIYSRPPAVKLFSAYFFNSGITAVVGFSYAIAQLVQRYLPSFLLNNIIEPTIMAKYTEAYNFRQCSRYLSIILKINLLILIPLTGWFYWYGDVVISVITGGKYPGSAWIICWLLIILMLQTFTDMLQHASNAVQKSDLLFRSNIKAWFFLAPLLVVVYFLKLPGLLGGLTIIMIFRNGYIAGRLRTQGYDVSPDWLGIGKMIITTMAALLIAGIAAQMVEKKLYQCLTSLSVGAVVCFGLLMVLNPFTAVERQTINNLLGRRLFDR